MYYVVPVLEDVEFAPIEPPEETHHVASVFVTLALTRPDFDVTYKSSAYHDNAYYLRGVFEGQADRHLFVTDVGMWHENPPCKTSGVVSHNVK